MNRHTIHLIALRVKLLIVLQIIFVFYISAQDFATRFEQTNGKETPNYHQIISWWKMMDERFPTISMRTMGPTDAGFPLHLVIVSNDRDFDMASLRRKNKRIILINNGIHPGEP